MSTWPSTQESCPLTMSSAGCNIHSVSACSVDGAALSARSVSCSPENRVGDEHGALNTVVPAWAKRHKGKGWQMRAVQAGKVNPRLDGPRSS